MTRKIEVHYVGGSVDVIPVSEFNLGTSDNEQFLTFDGNRVLLRADQITTVILHEDIPEPEEDSEDEDAESEPEDEEDPLEDVLQRLEKVYQDLLDKMPKYPVYEPNRTITPAPGMPWITWNSGRSNGVMPVSGDSRASGGPVNVYVDSDKTQDAGKIAQSVADALGFYRPKESDADHAYSEAVDCECATDPGLKCDKHPYGYYL